MLCAVLCLQIKSDEAQVYCPLQPLWLHTSNNFSRALEGREMIVLSTITELDIESWALAEEG